MKQTSLGTAYEIPLGVTLNTDTVDYDVQPMPVPGVNPGKHIQNNGIMRDGYITNLYTKTGGNASNLDTFVTSAGDECSIDTAGYFYKNGTPLGIFPTSYFFIGRGKIGQFDDAMACQVTSGNHRYAALKTLYFGTGNNTRCYLSEYDYEGNLVTSNAYFTLAGGAKKVAIARTPNTTFANIRYYLVSDTPTTFKIYDTQTSSFVVTVTTTYTIDSYDNMKLYIVGQYFLAVFPGITQALVGGQPKCATYGKLDNTGITHIPGRYTMTTWTSTQVTVRLTWDFDSGDTSGWRYSDILLQTTGITATNTATSAGTLVNRVSSHGMTQVTNGAGVGSYNQQWSTINTTDYVLASSRNSNFSNFVASSAGGYTSSYLWTVGGKFSHISLMGGSSGGGLLATEVGEVDPLYQPEGIYFGGGAQALATMIFKDVNGTFFTLNQLSLSSGWGSYTRKPLMFEIAPNVVAVLNCSGYNVFDLNDNSIHRAFNPYNGAFIQNDVSGTNSSLVVLKQEGKYGNSVDVGPILTNTGTTVQNTIYPLYGTANFLNSPIDVYVAGNYSNSQIEFNGQTATPTITRDNNQDLIGTLYVENSNLPAPAGYTVADSCAVGPKKTLFLNQGTLTYPLGNEIAKFYNVFRLQGNLYGFDGTDIWLLPFNNNVIQNPIWIAPATGLTFLCESPQAAWFLAEYDNSLFAFDGGRSVQRAMFFNQKPAIQQAIYNVEENALHIITASSYLIVRDGLVTEHTRPFVSGTIYQNSTKNGVINQQNGTWSTLLYKPDTYSGEVVQTLTWQSGYFGPEDGQMIKTPMYLIRLYRQAGAGSMTFTINYNWFTMEKNGTETKSVSLVAGDFDANGYAVVRFCPVQDYALASSIGLQFTEKVLILSCVQYMNEGGPGIPVKVV